MFLVLSYGFLAQALFFMYSATMLEVNEEF